ncbi:gamma-tubulin complex component 2-like isoform X1 [Salvia splendens]|uniref:gamma-tubulin complex component 2-like isoform X1 n=2 Tax=Salvia splendens TaxID=180675 RepID=UPI001C25C890|nr:gamma-tubulin complex component 2-like isoform X1 [Salvia splendens]XP_042059833.1 gamma-tubulin complex component 2-like isoform X1 [Salvia splendens]XP_042059834.1 gamma-tubulin complex component 2-like isoform X1 [Salvia splendens]XP_042059835.1 gamma-tubulin complex component 2-like isoform X1 [Salvia splendens]
MDEYHKNSLVEPSMQPLHAPTEASKQPSALEGCRSSGVDKPIGCFHAAIQELIVIDDILSALVGIDGRYISIRRVEGKDDTVSFQVDASMDLALQESAKRIFPLCESYILISQFVESRSQFKSGLVNHAFAAALRTLLLDYQAMVAQLEHQFRLGKLSVQGLWFYCQPMLGAMPALTIVIKKASASNFIGSAVLNLLQSQAKAMAGDHVVRSLLEKMSQSASQAYLVILERWVYEGVIDDPYGEFFIAENKSLQKESLTQDYYTKYWQQRYSLKDDIPSFLANAAETILTTGKYLNVMRECGHCIQVPVAENTKLTMVGSNHRYLECIKAAYDFASGELLNLIKDKYDLKGKLMSIKHYLLLDQGDFLVHFMDIAREELMKKPDEISVEKLQSLLDLALRSTAAVADPYHEDLTCCVEKTTLLKRLIELKDLQISQTISGNDDLEEPLSITGLETFSLSFKVQWPLSLVISKKALTKYQLIFRCLFHCKYVNRQLGAAWQLHQGLRRLDKQGIAISVSSLLCRNMLKFINSLLHYLTFEVLEPNWHIMDNRLQTAKSIDEVLQHHDFFLDKCLRECLLLSPVLLKKLETMKSICLQYAAAAQWLVTYSIDAPKTDSPELDKYKKLKLRTRSQTQKVTAENATVIESILKFERKFSAELQSLGPILSSSSRAEPYLTHLAQWLLGVGSD